MLIQLMFVLCKNARLSGLSRLRVLQAPSGHRLFRISNHGGFRLVLRGFAVKGLRGLLDENVPLLQPASTGGLSLPKVSM